MSSFGLFVHYSMPTYVGKPPVYYDPKTVPAARFDPPGFWAQQVCRKAKAAGMDYLVLTARHLDGFCMWPSARTSYNASNSLSPVKDPVAAYAQRCREEGLAFGLYYNWCNKHHPHSPAHDEQERLACDRYLGFVLDQLTELLTGYGPIERLWLDLPPRHGPTLTLLREHVKGIQPECIFVPNSHADVEQADARTYEAPWQMVPDGNLVPAEQAIKVEQAITNPASWAWWQFADDVAASTTADQVRSWKAAASAKNASLLLSCSPGPRGHMTGGNLRLLEALAGL